MFILAISFTNIMKKYFSTAILFAGLFFLTTPHAAASSMSSFLKKTEKAVVNKDVNEAIFQNTTSSLYWLAKDNSLYLPKAKGFELHIYPTEEERALISADNVQSIASVQNALQTLENALLKNNMKEKATNIEIDDVIKTYVKKNYACSLFMPAGYTSSGEDPKEHISIYFLCSNTVNQEIKKMHPILKDLGLLGKKQGLSLIKQKGNFYAFNETGGIGGALSLVKKIGKKYVEVLVSQDIPPCKTLVEYKFPKSFFEASEECYEEESTTAKKISSLDELPR